MASFSTRTRTELNPYHQRTRTGTQNIVSFHISIAITRHAHDKTLMANSQNGLQQLMDNLNEVTRVWYDDKCEKLKGEMCIIQIS